MAANGIIIIHSPVNVKPFFGIFHKFFHRFLYNTEIFHFFRMKHRFLRRICRFLRVGRDALIPPSLGAQASFFRCTTASETPSCTDTADSVLILEFSKQPLCALGPMPTSAYVNAIISRCRCDHRTACKCLRLILLLSIFTVPGQGSTHRRMERISIMRCVLFVLYQKCSCSVHAAQILWMSFLGNFLHPDLVLI